MRTRARLTTSIPFWVLVAGSLAALGAGIWNVLRGVDAMEQVLTNPNATVVEVYVGQTWANVGAGLLAAGAIGLFIALALGAASVFAKRSDVAIETIDWNSDDETAAEPATSVFTPATAAGTTAAGATTTGASAPAAATTTEPAPVALEDPDVETSSDTPAPPQAAEAARADAAEDPARP